MPRERHDLLKRAYDVSDPATGAVIGRLLPQAADWQIVDAIGQPVADVVQSSASFHQTSYAITAGGEDLGRLVAVMGATAASAEVQIEFLPASVGRLDRSLAIALAPLIEDRARRATVGVGAGIPAAVGAMTTMPPADRRMGECLLHELLVWPPLSPETLCCNV